MGRLQFEFLMEKCDNIHDYYNVISIIDDLKYPVFEEDTDQHITLRFDDVTAQWGRDDVIVFNEDHAEKVLSFVDSMDSSLDLIVHCTAGISRSGAVGLTVTEALGLDPHTFNDYNVHIQPNPLVVKVMRDCIERLQ